MTWQGGQSAEPHEENFASPDRTADAWFEFWIENIIGDLAPNTRRNYRERYVNNIQAVIGRMLLQDVLPMHCKNILIGMDADYAGSTIQQIYIAMGTVLCSAVMSGVIPKHPVDGVRYTKPVRVPSDIKYLTVEEKVLQKLLGHASIQTTMDKYVHVTDDSLTAGVWQFEASRMQLHIS